MVICLCRANKISQRYAYMDISAGKAASRLLFFNNDRHSSPNFGGSQKFPDLQTKMEHSNVKRQTRIGVQLSLAREGMAQLCSLREIIELWLLSETHTAPRENGRDLISCTEKQVASIILRQRKRKGSKECPRDENHFRNRESVRRHLLGHSVLTWLYGTQPRRHT